MFRKHLLYLTNERLLAVIWRNGKTLSAESFAVDDAGQVAFANYLKRWAKLRAYFLVDLIEEDFRLDLIPHVRGSDRRELLDRKLNQMFRGMPFRHAIVLDREVAGRRDDRVLYTSITNSELLTPWLDLLDAERVPLVGIYSAPLLSARLLKPLGQTSKHELLVTIHQGNHLRQSYTHSGKTKFSRMTPMGGSFANNRVLAIDEEVRKTWEYLESLRYFESGETLHVCVIAEASDFKGSADALAQQSGLSWEFFDIAKAAKSIGLTQPPANSNAEWLLLHLLGRLAPKNHFARRELMHRSVIWRIKQTAIAAGAGALLLGTSLGSANFIDGKLNANQALKIQGETVRIEQERQLIMRSLPNSSVAPDMMGRTVNFYNQTVQGSPDFTRAVVALSRILVRFPHTELSDLAWTATTDPNKPTTNATTFGVDIPAQTTANSAPNMPVDGRLYQVLVLVATLDGIGQNQRQALDHIGSLKRAIETDMGANVRILAQPLDSSASASLHGSAKPIEEKTNAAFALKIVLPPKT
jgi:hypothetical protein